jgi:rhodanese-related sulfurtransferase
MAINSISPRQLHEMMQSGRRFDLIDVRTPVEFREVHSTVARNVPLDRLDAAALADKPFGTAEPLYLICQAGGRGMQACEKLAKAGYSNVVNVEGGSQAWVQAGLPVVRGIKSMSLERQVRIAAGSLVLFGALLGYFAHPYWIALSGFVGAGLMFAGITDSCGMGMMLAKMPWNQARSTDSESSTPACSGSEECGRTSATL